MKKEKQKKRNLREKKERENKESKKEKKKEKKLKIKINKKETEKKCFFKKTFLLGMVYHSIMNPKSFQYQVIMSIKVLHIRKIS